MKYRPFIFSTMFLLLQTGVEAQKGAFSIEAGPSAGFAIIKAENFNSFYKPGFGAGIGALYNTSANGGIFFKVNYLTMCSKVAGIGSLALTTFRGGYQSYFNNSKAFVFADAGLSTFSSGNSSSSTSATAGGGLGYSIAAGKNSNIDLTASYDALFGSPIHSEWLNIHMGYRIRIK